MQPTRLHLVTAALVAVTTLASPAAFAQSTPPANSGLPTAPQSSASPTDMSSMMQMMQMMSAMASMMQACNQMMRAAVPPTTTPTPPNKNG